MLPLSENNKGTHFKSEKIHQEFQWVNNLQYEACSPNIIEMEESKTNKKGGVYKTTFCFISSIKISHSNFKKIIQGGRCRWKIENQGFQTLKDKQGYNAEHAFNLHPNGGNVFYLIMQIAFTINQLMQHSDLLTLAIKYLGSIRNFAERVRTEFISYPFYEHDIEIALASAYQIRLNSS